MPTFQQAVNRIKADLEQAIRARGTVGKTSLIRSGKLVNILHEAVKEQLVANQIPRELIRPPLGRSNGEVKVYGQLKQKKQDVTVLPAKLERTPEEIMTGYHLGETDPFGRAATEMILSINVRTQLSSLDKNFDTLYERTLAEAINLHARCPRMCLGELYMIPVYEYNQEAIKAREVRFSNRLCKLEKYLRAFDQISDRATVEGELYKYEHVCLLIVDFNRDIPKIYSTNQELKDDELIPQDSTASIHNLSFGRFSRSLLETYRARFPEFL